MPVEFSLSGDKVQLLEFIIRKEVLEPKDLPLIKPPDVDPSKPLIISGRGPHWLYQFLVHRYHFCRILATFEPRMGKGVIVESPSSEEIGMSLDTDGKISEQRIGAEGSLYLDILKLSNFQLAYVKVEGSFAEPLKMREVEWNKLRDSVDQEKPVIFYGMAPIWLGARTAAVLSNVPCWYAVYDPRIGGAVVTARHSPKAPDVGSVVRTELKIVENKE
ncbi:MAG: CRISPR-associated protein Csx3 [Thermoproteota archaeon]|jgi:CRISPR-associated protein Csx3|uniref:CRISPR-associated ring nuclease Crn3/Csx3 n=1 Tax=Candidatus Methanodesulfokora washburnensis TaxID=2478471 RepID=UPI00122332D7|nr:CRISPR-associated ring nuclease Crn3/Csx3 [Candidatus Methanodesulfokores washburnensis]TDA40633.1 MAG: CRISPR-associated protein Csx3 [Candidatus Korarchaeota archaeon]